MSTILLVTDFSIAATHAAKYVTSLIEKMGTTKIVLYHSYAQKETERIMVTDVLGGAKSGEYALYHESLNSLNDLKNQLIPLINTEVQLEILSDDKPLIEGVTSLVLEHNIVLVVVGVYGGQDDGAYSIGKNTAKLIKEERFPLLIVPLGAEIKAPDKLMLACNLRYVTESTPFAQINIICKQLGATLDVVNIDSEESEETSELLESVRLLHQSLDSLQPTFHYLQEGKIVDALLNFAKNNQTDLIIAVPRKLGFLQALFHESATRNLAIDTNIPLLIFHQHQIN